MTGPHHLGCQIDEFAPQCRGVTVDGQDVLQVIIFKPLERKLLASKLLQATMGQLIGATLMVVVDQGGVLFPVFPNCARHPFQNRLSGAAALHCAIAIVQRQSTRLWPEANWLQNAIDSADRAKPRPVACSDDDPPAWSKKPWKRCDKSAAREPCREGRSCL